ncbi:MAG: hypothetical protein ACK4WH_11015 [Phycisphaerales bacterium]
MSLLGMLMVALVSSIGLLGVDPEVPQPAPACSHANDSLLVVGWNWDAHKCVSVTPCAGFAYDPSGGGVNLVDCDKNLWGNCSGKCKYCSGTPGVAGVMCEKKDYEVCIIGAGVQTCGVIGHYKCAAAATPRAGQEITQSGCYCTTFTGWTTSPCVIGACQ